MKQSTLSNKELALFCEQMNMTIKAGMTPYEGIQIIMQDNEPSLQKSLKQVEEQLDLGNNLYHSLKESKAFPNYMLDMIQIGGDSDFKVQTMTTAGAYHYKLD